MKSFEVDEIEVGKVDCELVAYYITAKVTPGSTLEVTALNLSCDNCELPQLGARNIKMETYVPGSGSITDIYSRIGRIIAEEIGCPNE